MIRCIIIAAAIVLLFAESANAEPKSLSQPVSLAPTRECSWKEPPAQPLDESFGAYILGEPELNADDLDAFATSINPDAPKVGRYYIEFGRKLGIRGDIAFAQSLLETGHFRYIPLGQNNFAGIGAVGGGELGHFFKTPAEGVQAQLEHLLAYSTEISIDSPVDPRFHLVKRGCAPTWQSLGGKWAVPGYNPHRFSSFEEAFGAGDTYGQRILRIYAEMKRFTKEKR